MTVAKLRAGVGEESRRSAWLGRDRLGLRLANFVEATRGRIFHRGAGAVAPIDLDAKCLPCLGRESALGLVAADVAAAGHHFLCLLPPARRAVNANARSGALGVFAVAGQAHGHTWRCGIVPVDQRRPLEAADHGIEIAVVVEVA